MILLSKIKTVLVICFCALLVLSSCQNPSKSVVDETVIIDASDLKTKQYQLDIQMEKELDLCESNVELTDTYKKYSNKWNELGETYYSALLSSDETDNFKAIIAKNEKNWNEYLDTRLSNQSDLLIGMYDGGTIVPIALSKYKLEMRREHTLELYKICIESYIIVESPDTQGIVSEESKE